MYYFITLTDECNLQCDYCYGKWLEDLGTTLEGFTIDFSVPTQIDYDLSILQEFCGRDPDPHLIFYGGEPTLCLDSIREIMDAIPAKEYLIHTNGLLLDRLESRYMNKFSTILVSIDGCEEITDRQRGQGSYRRIIENLKAVGETGYRGEVVARMTVTQETDIEEEVKWLLFNKEYPFSSVHWQLDALFWKNDFHPSRFKDWSQRCYNPGIRRLARSWVDHMKNEGEVLRIYPFIAPTQSLLIREPSRLRCGAGWISFNIQTDGNISPCPAMVGMKDYYLGNIKDVDPVVLKDAIRISGRCTDCSIFDLCGGRCLYANLTQLWGSEGFSLVCGTVKNLFDSLKGLLPRIRSLIKRGSISIEDFKYPKYNSCEIIP